MRPVTDAERAAITLLMQASGQLSSGCGSITAQPLREYVTKLTSDPNYVEIPPDIFGYDYKQGYATPEEARKFRQFHQQCDRAVAGLCFAVYQHRERDGREGDYQHPLGRCAGEGDGFEDTEMSGANFIITTSLAAAIVEYHNAIVNAFVWLERYA